jgi:hypothetical protein
MPTLQKIFTLDITPEKFIDNCSDVELQEVILLANKKLSWHDIAPAVAKTPPTVNCPPPLPAAPPVPKSPKIRQSWPPEEEEKLRELWPSMSGMEVAEKLGRAYKTVMAHASKLGLSKRSTYKRNLPDARQQPEPVPEPEHLTPASKPKKKLISVRVDRRTIVQVPEGTDIKKLKAKYANE